MRLSSTPFYSDLSLLVGNFKLGTIIFFFHSAFSYLEGEVFTFIFYVFKFKEGILGGLSFETGSIIAEFLFFGGTSTILVTFLIYFYIFSAT